MRKGGRDLRVQAVKAGYIAQHRTPLPRDAILNKIVSTPHENLDLSLSRHHFLPWNRESGHVCDNESAITSPTALKTGVVNGSSLSRWQFATRLSGTAKSQNLRTCFSSTEPLFEGRKQSGRAVRGAVLALCCGDVAVRAILTFLIPPTFVTRGG